MQSFASTNLNSADYRIDAAQPPRSPHLTDRFDTLFALAEVAAELGRRGLPVAASTLKEATVCVIEQWLDQDIDQEQAATDLACLLADARAVIASDDAARMEQLAAARAHAAATAARWAAEGWGDGPQKG
jgi:hypothetical protein